MIIGVALSMPVIVYQVLSFVTPALYENERKYLYIAVPGRDAVVRRGRRCSATSSCCRSRSPSWAASRPTSSTRSGRPRRYLDFVSTFLFWVGLTFELPIVMYFLSKMGIVSAKRMASFRKYAFVLAFVIGAVITPTPDPDQPDDRESADLLPVRAGRDPGEVCMT